MNQVRCQFPLDGAGAWESHAMVRPQSAAAFAVALTVACADVGLRPPEVVTDGECQVRFWWHAKPRRVWVSLDAEGEAVFCFDAEPGGPRFDAMLAGDPAACGDDGEKPKHLRDCLERVKAFLETGRVGQDGAK